MQPRAVAFLLEEEGGVVPDFRAGAETVEAFDWQGALFGGKGSVRPPTATGGISAIPIKNRGDGCPRMFGKVEEAIGPLVFGEGRTVRDQRRFRSIAEAGRADGGYGGAGRMGDERAWNLRGLHLQPGNR